LCPETVEYATVENGTTPDKFIRSGFAFGAVWKNYGNVPAVQIGVVVWINDEQGEPIVPLRFTDEEIPRSGIHGPGTAHSTSACFIDDEVSRAFRAGQVKLMIKSKVFYRSALGDEDYRSTVTFQAEHMGGTRVVNGRETEAIVFKMIETTAT
jgi:hypothetical protein